MIVSIPMSLLAMVVLQGSAGIGGVAPVLLPDVPVSTVLAAAMLNPVTIVVAYLMGGRADQRAKLLVAAFAAAVAGAALLWIGTLMRLPFLATAGRAAGGIFAVGLCFGLVVAAIGYARRDKGHRLIVDRDMH
jgi:hypothetical protein